MSLDLYAKIEPYIGFYDDYERLYGHYMEILQGFRVKDVLDVGCGNGRVLELLEKNGYNAEGIDLSEKMVEIAKDRGVKAEQKDISKVDKKYDAIIAVADVLNYIKDSELRKFLKDIKNALKESGVFICDTNTLYGFSDVADGTLIKEDEDAFLAIDAVFDGEILDTNITFFEKEGNLYKKYNGNILQYYHKEEEIIDMSPMKFVDKKRITLFCDTSDKVIFVFMNA